MKTVIKRDGREMSFDSQKICNAIKKSIEEAYSNKSVSEINDIVTNVKDAVIKKIDDENKDKINIEEIQNIIEKILKKKYPEAKKAYSGKRKERTNIRETKSDIMKVINKIGVETDRDNANVGNNFSAKLLRIASEANKWQNLAAIIPKKIAKLHENGDIYIHDLDSYNLTTNCLHIPTKKMLEKGFNTGYGTINKPRRIESAAELSCILLQSAQNDMFGGQSHPNFDNDLGDYVEPTRKEIREEIYKMFNGDIEEKKLRELTEKKLEKTVHQAMQAIVYNLNTMHSRAGSQVPFSSVNIGIPKNDDAAIVCRIFLEEYKKGLGKGEQPIFPNIIFRVKKGVNAEEGDKYHNLFKLACDVASKRMNPTFMNLDADFNKKYYDMGYIPATMGCRTYLMSNINGEPGVEGRGNIAPTTMNLPRLGILASKEKTKEAKINKFFKLLDTRLNDSKECLLHRYSVLKNLKIKDLPFVAGQGLMRGSENLGPDDSIEPILKQGTWGIGFIGLAEALIAILGHHHGENDEAKELGFKIISHIREFTDKTSQETHLNWSCYATPAEGLSGKFTVKDKERFGIIPGITDKEYYTNSYHVPVNYKISIIDKINIEAPYHKLCNGGHISYIELDDYPTGDQVEKIISYAYNNTNISYVGINFHIRYCRDCGTYLHSEESCPKCGSKNIQGISRVTGYLSLDERFPQPDESGQLFGKGAEKRDRISHNRKDKHFGYRD